MKTIIYSMILLCSVPANAGWDFSWESAKSYIPSIELPPIKPNLGWIFGASCLVVSIACIALIKNNTKYEIAQAKEDTVREYESILHQTGIFLEGDSIKVRGVNFNQQNITFALDDIPQGWHIFMKDASKNSLLKIVRRSSGSSQVVLDGSMLDPTSTMSLRFKEKNTFYKLKGDGPVATLVKKQILEEI